VCKDNKCEKYDVDKEIKNINRILKKLHDADMESEQ
jgi:hypothetical protein